MAETGKLKKIRVSDVMNRQVICVRSTDLMCQAAEQMTDSAVTGVPVVDDAGRCVGVLSSSDFTRRERERDCEGRLAAGNVQEVLVQNEPGGAYHIETVLEDVVTNYMSAAVQTISPAATLFQAARCMCLEHVHRLVVVDEDNRPVGMLSTLDILAALLAAMEEE